MLNERKVAQMAAFFLMQEGGRISHLKLMKLLYLSERRSVLLYAMPMANDKLVAMPHGPVLSLTLNLMDGFIKSKNDGWDQWISDKEDHQVSIKKKSVTKEDLDELSQADMEILKFIWKEFGKMDQWQIRDYTHDHCPEWQDPHGSSQPISYKSLCEALGFSKEQSIIMAKNIEDQCDIEENF